MLERVLEAEVMDTPEEAAGYDAMDHATVNRLFVEDLIAAAEAAGVDLAAGEILDLGAGTAQIPIELCRRVAGARVIALDAAGEMLKIAEENIRRASLVGRIACRQADAKRLPMPDASVPVVLSNSILHHIPEPFEAIREAVRVAAPGGLLFFRDLLRPANEQALGRLVGLYAAGADTRQRRMFADSLHAALSLEEVATLVGRCGLDPANVKQTSDRHWTWSTHIAASG